METTSGMPPEHLRPTAAERFVCGAVLRDADAVMDDVARELPGGPGDFCDWACGRVYAAALAVRARGPDVRVVTPTVFLHLKQTGEAADIPDLGQFLADLLTEAQTGANAAYHASLVREAATRRRMLHLARELLAESQLPPAASAGDDLADWERRVRAVADGSEAAGDPPVLPDLVRDALADLDARQAGGGAAGLSTGLPDLDSILGGMRPGQLLVVGARPGAGKTALALAVLAHAVRHQGVPAYLASLEMPCGEITHRLLAMATGVNLHRITRARLSGDDAERLTGATHPGVYGRSMLYVDDAPSLTTGRLHAQARRLIRRRGVGLVAVDYLQLLQAADPKENRVQQVGRMARDLKLVARDCGVPVLLLSQLNRQSEDRGDGTPRLSDLRESGEIEQHADGVVLLHVPRGQPEDSDVWQVTAVVAKNRNGPVGDVQLAYRRPLVRFESLARGAAGADTRSEAA